MTEPEAQPQGGELLPEWSDCEAACDNKTATPLQRFIYEYEPGDDTEIIWRERLAAAIARADLPRATVDGPVTTYKNKRRLTDVERFNWRKVYNDYTFSNCDHEHDGYPAHLVCAECALELLAHFAATPRATGEIEAALAELREIYPKRWINVICATHSAQQVATKTTWTVSIDQLVDDFEGPSLADCMAQVRAASRTEVEGER